MENEKNITDNDGILEENCETTADAAEQRDEEIALTGESPEPDEDSASDEDSAEGQNPPADIKSEVTDNPSADIESDVKENMTPGIESEPKDNALDDDDSLTSVIPISELDFTQKLENDKGETRPEIKNYAHAKAILEALLFTTAEPVSIKKISSIMNELPSKTLRAIILDLQLEYDQQGRGIQILEIAGGYQMATRQYTSDWVYSLHKNRKRAPLTPATLETLAIIAYKQPITRVEIEAVRGVDSGGILRNLQDQNLIKVVGRKEVVGRPPQYGTTESFLKIFGLKKLSDLPSISELKEMFTQKSLNRPEPEEKTEAPKDKKKSKEDKAKNGGDKNAKPDPNKLPDLVELAEQGDIEKRTASDAGHFSDDVKNELYDEEKPETEDEEDSGEDNEDKDDAGDETPEISDEEIEPGSDDDEDDEEEDEDDDDSDEDEEDSDDDSDDDDDIDEENNTEDNK